MVGCTPQRVVSDQTKYVLDAYCGSASDRLIIERSDKDKDKFQDHDSIRADMDIMDYNLLALRFVNTPKMFKGKNQLEAQDVVKDRRIASERILIETIIGLANTYTLLITSQLYC